MIEWLSLAGTVSGLITTCVQRYNDHKKMLVDLEALKVRNDHDLKLRELDAKLLEKEYAARIQVASIEADSTMNSSEMRLVEASMNADRKEYSAGITPDKAQAWVWVALDAIRALVRPALTALVASAFTTISVIAIWNVIKEGGLNNYSIAEQGLGTLGYSMNAVLTHYFGTRNKASEANARKR